MLKRAGALGAIGALGAVGANALSASPAAATPAPDVPYRGAPTIGAFLRAGGVGLNGGFATQDGDNAIECVYFEQKSAVPLGGSGQPSGKRKYDSIVIRKPIDDATPLLHKALVQNKVVDGTFKFYRPTNDNAYYTVAIKSARIASLDNWSPDNESKDGSVGGGRPMQEVSITFQSIGWISATLISRTTATSRSERRAHTPNPRRGGGSVLASNVHSVRVP